MSLLAVLACTPDAPTEPYVGSFVPVPIVATASEPFEPIPAALDLDPGQVELGRRLFADVRVSGDGTRACVDCHALEEAGVVPREARSNHPDNATGPYNVPTVFNVAFNFRYNWQGGFETLEDHAGGVMMNANVMAAGTWPELLERLRPAYAADFRAAFAEGLSEDNVRAAFAAYERSLVTPDAPFDRYLRGEAPLSPEAARGYALFRELGCASCHQGVNVGGNLFQRFGVVEDPFEGRVVDEMDYGRMLKTKEPVDAFVFRVPSLRNVAVTAPYFHDGSAETLDDAVRTMARVQLGFRLENEEVAALVAFLESLTGEYRGVSLAEMGP